MLTPEMQKIDTRLAINLLYHLKEEKEFPELANIGDWAQLTSDKTSSNLIAGLRLAASQVHFVGNCPGC